MTETEAPVTSPPPPATPVAPSRHVPTAGELFLAFAKMAVCGFGGVLAWSRRVIVQERGWLTQINSTSLLGRDGTTNERVGWELVLEGLADVVATDSHRAHRPPYLDAVHDALARRIGLDEADRLTCGVALPAAVP